jgi:hypothetical protein
MRIPKNTIYAAKIISNTLGFMNRMNGLFTSAAFYLVFILYKYESGTNPGPAPDQAARFLLTVCPPVLMVISFAFSFFIDFKKAAYTPAIAGSNSEVRRLWRFYASTTYLKPLKSIYPYTSSSPDLEK